MSERNGSKSHSLKILQNAILSVIEFGLASAIRGRRKQELTKKNSPSTISFKEGSAEDFLSKTIVHLIRFSALANAGGVVVTITILGATAKGGEVANILALPLALFSSGIICALLSASSAVLAFMEKVNKEKLESSPFGKIKPFFDQWDWATVVGMVGFFILGCLSGVFIIVFA